VTNVSLNALLAANRIRAHATSKQELDALRALVERDLLDADIRTLSADRRFATTYNAALQLCRMAIACAGYRVATGLGHHQTTFEAAAFALGSAATSYTVYFDTCRRKRNIVDYDAAHVVSETEADELVAKTHEFNQLVEDWIGQHHPHLWELQPPQPPEGETNGAH
jgi:hypothetical protein